MTIEQRMELLERTNRRWRRLACTMAVLIVAGVGIGAAQMNEDELTLRKLVIQDEEGRKRIVLDTNERGASIVHYDANGQGRIRSGTYPSGNASMTHYDAKEKMRIRSGTHVIGSASTSYYDADEKMRIDSGVFANGEASTTYSDMNGKTRISSGTFTDGDAGTIWMEYDANGKIQPVKTLP